MSDPNEPRSVEQFELNRYLGLWYEIGRLPLRYEDDTATDVTAQYSLNDDGTIHVDNRCYDRFGEPTQALGQAEPDAEHAGRLRVTFLPAGMRWVPFTHADYWVLRIDAETTTRSSALPTTNPYGCSRASRTSIPMSKTAISLKPPARATSLNRGSARRSQVLGQFSPLARG